MDILSFVSGSAGGLTAFVMFGALGAALMVFIAGAALALRANRAADESRLALEQAEMKLKSAADLADEVRTLRSDVERAFAQQQDAITNARLQHNEACGAHMSNQSTNAFDAEPQYKGGGHDDDDHKKHHSAFSGHDDDDHHKKKHSLKGGGHDDDDHHKKKHSAFDDREDVRQGFFGWLFDR